MLNNNPPGGIPNSFHANTYNRKTVHTKYGSFKFTNLFFPHFDSETGINKGFNDLNKKKAHYYTYFCLSIMILWLPYRHARAKGNVGATGDYRHNNIQKTNTINAKTSCLFKKSIEVNVTIDSIYKTVLHYMRFGALFFFSHPFP